MSARMDTQTLRVLKEAATPGPWQLCAHLGKPDENGCTCGYRGVVFGRGHYAICQPGHEPPPDGQEGTEPPRLPRSEEIANMRLIVQAPTLAAEVLQWRELSAQLVNTIADSDLPLAQRKAVIATIRAMKQPVSGDTDQPQHSVNRFEVIDETGRVYSRHGVRVRLMRQDDGRTLKAFVETVSEVSHG